MSVKRLQKRKHKVVSPNLGSLPTKRILSYIHVKLAVEEYMKRLSLIDDDEVVLTLEPTQINTYNVYVGREVEVKLADKEAQA